MEVFKFSNLNDEDFKFDVSFDDNIADDMDLQKELESLGDFGSSETSNIVIAPKISGNLDLIQPETIDSLDVYSHYNEKKASLSDESDNIWIHQEIAECISVSTARQNAVKYMKQKNEAVALLWYRRMNEIAKEYPSNEISTAVHEQVQSIKYLNEGNTKKGQSGLELLNELEKKLKGFQDKYLDDAKKYQNVDKSKAVSMMKQYKYFQEEIFTLQSRKNAGDYRLPIFHYETIKSEIRIQNNDITDDCMSMHIQCLNGLSKTFVGNTFSLNYAFGYKTEDTISSGTISKCRGVLQDNACNIELNSNIINLNIIKRTIQGKSKFSRLRGKFELYKHGFITKTLIGVAVISFTELLDKCEMQGNFPLLKEEKSNSPKVGGELQLKFRLRNPINKFESYTTEERFIRIDSWPSSNNYSDTLSIQGDSSSSTVHKIENIEHDFSVLTSREKSDPLAVEFIESNDVLVDEISLIQEKLQHCKLDETDKLVGRIRLHALQSKLTTLQQNVESGSLLLQQYLDNIASRMKRDELLLEYIRTIIPIDDEITVRLKKRISLLKNEISSAEEISEEECD